MQQENSSRLAKWLAYLAIALAILNAILIYSLNYASVGARIAEEAFTMSFRDIFSGESFTSKTILMLMDEEALELTAQDSGSLEKTMFTVFIIGCILLIFFALTLLQKIKAPLVTQQKSNILKGIYVGALCTCIGMGVLYYIVTSTKNEIENSMGMLNSILGIFITTDALLIFVLNALALVIFLLLGKSYKTALCDEIAANAK